MFGSLITAAPIHHWILFSTLLHLSFYIFPDLQKVSDSSKRIANKNSRWCEILLIILAPFYFCFISKLSPSSWFWGSCEVRNVWKINEFCSFSHGNVNSSTHGWKTATQSLKTSVYLIASGLVTSAIFIWQIIEKIPYSATSSFVNWPLLKIDTSGKRHLTNEMLGHTVIEFGVPELTAAVTRTVSMSSCGSMLAHWTHETNVSSMSAEDLKLNFEKYVCAPIKCLEMEPRPIVQTFLFSYN